ncbi:M23 family peptidase [Kibdelosporangium aridum]|uniref:M23 family peptidase n=1 Tax=Kibdelosporangium aridum TaxID=2030 RepID=A0A428YKE3_KIBAR|nr:M23 family metallopeptidase [Kibdelosporangium aridum]RSM68114.1 M23 family peptidase [Kibdelosporangium aridum]
MLEALDRTSGDERVERGAHRLPAPPSALRGRVVVAAVAIGAFAAAAAGQTLKAGASSSDDVAPLANSGDASAAFGVGGDSRATTIAPEVLTVAQVSDAGDEARKLTQSAQLIANRTAKLQQEAEAAAEKARVKFVRPADGVFTSGYGARWGTTHFGVDIAGKFGSPIRAVTDGVVIEAGPASGFGLWVRIQHPDGTISVYGHMDSITVREGAKVKAGDQIARMGNRGQSTGTHLHFEIWDSSGRKMNPASWLSGKGVKL